MSAIINYYNDVFVPSCEKEDDQDYVDISSLIRESENWSPVPLLYDNKAESLRNIPAAIVLNFCKSHRSTKMFRRKAILAMTKIILKRLDPEDKIFAPQIFILHIVKKDIDDAYFTYLVVHATSIKIKHLPCEDENEWLKLAGQVIRHKQIQETINQCLIEFGQVPLAVVDEEEDDAIKVRLVSSDDEHLRGFVGISEIFINATHFQKKIARFEGSLDALQLIAKMDIISVSIHEVAHLRFRKCTNNFDHHTPIIAQQKGLGRTHFEFGVNAEHKVFNMQVDWFMSQLTLDMGYVERFVNAIEAQTVLPPGFVQGAIRRGVGVDIDGTDFKYDYNLC